MVDPASVCLVTLLMFQDAPFSLDIWEHAKNSMNTQEITIPYDCNRFDALPIGKDLASGDINLGSLIIRNRVKVFHLKVIRKQRLPR